MYPYEDAVAPVPPVPGQPEHRKKGMPTWGKALIGVGIAGLLLCGGVGACVAVTGNAITDAMEQASDIINATPPVPTVTARGSEKIARLMLDAHCAATGEYEHMDFGGTNVEMASCIMPNGNSAAVTVFPTEESRTLWQTAAKALGLPDVYFVMGDDWGGMFETKADAKAFAKAAHGVVQ